jgi:hypothetical protein
VPGFDPGNGGIKIHLFCLPFNGHSEKSTKFDPFRLDADSEYAAAAAQTLRAPLSIAASGVLTSRFIRL